MRQALVRKIIEMRASRRDVLPYWLFDGELAWDMLLELYYAKLTGSAVKLETLTEAGVASSSTAARWLRALQSANLVTITKHMFDGPEVVAISDKGYQALERHFETFAVALTSETANAEDVVKPTEDRAR